MLWQLLFVAVFALNVFLLWSLKNIWYQRLGSLLFAVLPLLTVFLEQPKFELDHFWWIVAGVVAVVIGIGIVIWSKIEGKEEFNQKGPYQFVRHPMYLGLVFVFVGWWWAWSAVYSFYFGMFILALIWLQAYLEEKLVLLPKFGDKYRKYRSETGMFWIK